MEGTVRPADDIRASYRSGSVLFATRRTRIACLIGVDRNEAPDHGSEGKACQGNSFRLNVRPRTQKQ